MIRQFHIPSILTVVLFVFFISYSCDDSMDGFGDWPSDLRLMNTDFVTSESVYLTADLQRTVNEMTEMGFCWSTTNPPDINDISVSFQPAERIFNHRVAELTSGVTYYFRAFYVYQGRIFYSNTLSVSTTETVTDLDGNPYNTVKIGQQFWMKENLRVSVFRNGDDIEDGTNQGNYAEMHQPKFFFHYDDEPANADNYGNLYTWYAATDDRGICPAGWRVPDIADWERLSRHLDAETAIFQDLTEGHKEFSPIAGGILRTQGTVEEGTGLWAHPNEGATNFAEFNAVPGGYRDPSGAFDGIGHNASFWCFTQESTQKGIMIYTHFFNPGLHANAFTKASGYSIRCMKPAN